MSGGAPLSTVPSAFELARSVRLTGPSRFTNVAGLSTLATTFLEKEYDFWAANLFATISLVVSIVVLVVWAGKLGETLQDDTGHLRRLWLGLAWLGFGLAVG